MIKNKHNQPKPRKLLPRLLPALAITLAALAIYFFVDFTTLTDWFRTLGYEPTREVENIISDLSLTSRGDLILRASHPTLENNTAFATHCGSDHDGASILGCYANTEIYIKHVTDPELAGILESTSAHELLHAVWVRLDQPTRTALTAHLDTTYEKHKDRLAARLASYEQSRWHDELHSIFGTELPNTELPIALAEHYSQFFTDRTKIVAYFNAYDSKFQSLLAESQALETQIATARTQIATDTQNYEDSAATLNLAIADFNRRANSGYFASQSAFFAERANLESRVNALTALYENINRQISELNYLIDLYNANAAALSNLNKSISTPTSPPSV